MTSAVAVVLGLLPSASSAGALAQAAAKPPRTRVSITVSPAAATPAQADLKVKADNTGSQSVAVSRSDFVLSAQGDVFGMRSWSLRSEVLRIAPGHSRIFHLIASVPRAALGYASLTYRSAGETVSRPVVLTRPSGPALATASASPTVNTFWVSQGVGEPWGTTFDKAGNLWFAEPGCDFAPGCSSGTPPGQIGELQAVSHNVVFHTLPNLPGNQPIFLAFDSAGQLWFTTPNNSRIGEFSPSSGKFVGQWPVTAGSGPWDLTFGAGSLWYTEHFGSAVGQFNPVTHTNRDFKTPTASANPYGIAATDGRIWFTENNGAVDRVAVLGTNTHAISEYPIVLPLSGTPHMIAIGAGGNPWWTEGWSDTIATLNPAAATPGRCGVSSGICQGIRRFTLPPSTTCSTSAHTSGIAVQRSTNLVSLDNALTAQVGSFNPSNGAFALTTLSNCNAHPADGLTLDSGPDVWFNEEFGSALGELTP